MINILKNSPNNSEDNKKLKLLIDKIKSKYLELFISSKTDWGKRIPVALEFFDWLKDFLPFTDDEKNQIFGNKKTEKINILTREEKKKRSRWFKWRKDI